MVLVHTHTPSASLNGTDHPAFKSQMSLLYRAHALTLADCSLSTESVYWFRTILRMSSDNFKTILKD
jgi:hypothetical protein